MKLNIVLFLAVVSLVTGSQIDELKCWTQRNKTHYHGLGLEKSLNIDDTIECITKCRESDFCHAVDIDTATVPKCWYQQNNKFVANETDLQPLETATNYLYNPTCGKITAGVDLNCWTVTPAYHIIGLAQVDIKTLDECLRQCSASKDCQVVDWDVKTSPSCWIQKTPMEVSISKLVPRESVTNFILNRECFNLINGIDLTFWRVSDLIAYPGLVQVDKNDLRSCLNFCKSNELCNIVDFDPAKQPPCWIQNTAFQVKRGNLVVSPTAYNFFFKRAQYKKFQTCYQASV